eukprot:747901-Rhodomonas_salina.1
MCLGDTVGRKERSALEYRHTIMMHPQAARASAYTHTYTRTACTQYGYTESGVQIRRIRLPGLAIRLPGTSCESG